MRISGETAYGIFANLNSPLLGVPKVLAVNWNGRTISINTVLCKSNRNYWLLILSLDFGTVDSIPNESDAEKRRNVKISRNLPRCSRFYFEIYGVDFLLCGSHKRSGHRTQ